MLKPLSLFTYLLIGFLLGALFTDDITLDLATTNWTSLVTYLWLGLWPLMLALHALLWFLAATVILSIIFYLMKKREEKQAQQHTYEHPPLD